MADGAVYYGHEGMRSWHRDLAEAWGEEIRAEAEPFFDLGERTLLLFVFHGRGQRSGAEVSMPGAQLTTWRAGYMVHVMGYGEKADALRDLGVTADELDPLAP